MSEPTKYYCERCKRILSPQQIERLGQGPIHRVLMFDGPDQVHAVYETNASATDRRDGSSTSGPS